MTEYESKTVKIQLKIGEGYTKYLYELGSDLGLGYKGFLKIIIASYLKIKKTLTIHDMDIPFSEVENSDKCVLNINIPKSLYSQLAEESKKEDSKPMQLARKLLKLFLLNDGFRDKIVTNIIKTMNTYKMEHKSLIKAKYPEEHPPGQGA